MPSTRGTGTRRSNACWTCKLRRKKCDATKPACVACESRNITCHGYGDQPGWMNGGESERNELTHIKEAVKLNKKRKRTGVVQHGAIDYGSEPRPDVPSATLEPVSCSPDAGDPEPPLLEEAMSTMPFTVVPPTESTSFRFSYHREAELLMHYLDHVFALQFRFHSPSVGSGGRGWLLWLLTETKPLYHAALSLGALHQHSLLARSVRGQRHHDTLNELNEHHNRALQELQIFLQSSYDDTSTADSGRKRRLQILACGVQLISFEVSHHKSSLW